MKTAALILVLLCVPLALAAPFTGKGEGGIVLNDGTPVYKRSGNERTVFFLMRGDALAGCFISVNDALFTGRAAWEFVERDQRVRVCFTTPEKNIGNYGWIDPNAIARFVYDGSCGDDGSPFAHGVGIHAAWNVCFREARDAKLAELKPLWEKEDAAKKEP